MGELIAMSQYSSTLGPQIGLQAWDRGISHNYFAGYNAASFLKVRSAPAVLPQLIVNQGRNLRKPLSRNFRVTAATSESPVKSGPAFELAGEGIEIQKDFGDGADDSGDGFGRGGGGGGGGDGGNNGSNSNNNGEGEEGPEDSKNMGMLTSQKLTLGYAALVGLGGVAGYVKSGSQKSLVSGGVSALLLYYVYTQLPTKPVFASAIGFGLSLALLGVMGSRFKNTGKIFPAGIVAFVSLIMSGGYMHGIFRSVH